MSVLPSCYHPATILLSYKSKESPCFDSVPRTGRQRWTPEKNTALKQESQEATLSVHNIQKCLGLSTTCPHQSRRNSDETAQRRRPPGPSPQEHVPSPCWLGWSRVYIKHLQKDKKGRAQCSFPRHSTKDAVVARRTKRPSLDLGLLRFKLPLSCDPDYQHYEHHPDNYPSIRPSCHPPLRLPTCPATNTTSAILTPALHTHPDCHPALPTA